MEDKLKYYYNLSDIELIKNDNNYLIFDNSDNLYYLYKVDDDVSINNYPKYHEVILTINKENIININDNKYILFKINTIINEEVSLESIINNNKLNRKYSDNKIINIVELWSKRLDYLEYQVSELAKDKEEILNSFSYFIGLGENAISFININNINYNNLTKSITHHRLKSGQINLDYYNPINVYIDYEVRDYSEYLKDKVLKGEVYKDVKYILENANLTIDDKKLLYARLMFPTIYFDTLESILLDNKKESELNIFIETLPRYLNMLKDTYLEIKKDISIDIPNWIIKS